MLGLPVSTEIRKTIAKTFVLDTFNAMTPKRRKSFDAEISRITRVNEVSNDTMNIAVGENEPSFSVLHITMRCRDYDKTNIVYLARWFQKKTLFVLEFEGMQQLAIWDNRLIIMDWTEPEKLHVELIGSNLDHMWKNIVEKAVNEKRAQGWIPEEELVLQRKRKRLENEIAKYEKLLQTDIQPNRQMELSSHIEALKTVLNG